MNPIPQHIAVIMDGNGRWATRHGLSRSDGHKKGVEAVDDVVEGCLDVGVKYLTLYAFSDENWMRPQEEVDALMQLLAIFLKMKCPKMLEKGIRLQTIGDESRLPQIVIDEINDVKAQTASGKKMDLVLALSYGSHNEISRAFNKLLAAGKKEVTPEDIEHNLDTADMPHPDLLIRTSGEYRISNFMLWQIAYAELYFTETLWPDFGKKELLEAIEDYKKRERRFGRV